MTVTAGRLEWEVGLKESDKNRILREAEEYGRKLDQALNKRNSGLTGLSRVGEEAQRANDRVGRLVSRFAELQGQFRSGRITLDQYRTGLGQLQQGIERTRNRVDLSAKDWARLGTTMRNVQAAQATLTGSTAEVNARVRSLVNEVRELRNEWQRTGQHTDQTKARLNALQAEMRELSQELRNTDGGWARFNQQIAQLGVAGRSAEATIAGIEGRISRLGLASQVQLGVQQQLVSQMYRFGPAGQIAAGSLGLVGGQMGAMSAGAIAAAGGLVAVGGAAVALTTRGIPQVKEFQTAFRTLVASGFELSEAQLDDELNEIQEAAGRVGSQFSRAEMATSLAELVKAGLEASDAFDLLVPSMRLAAVTGEDLTTSSSRLLTNLRQFRLDVSEAGRAADVLALASLEAREGAAELSEGLAVVGPVARAAGFSLEDTTAILVELNNAGLSAADEAATALRGTLAALLDPTAEAKEVLAGLGVELRDSNGNARSLKDVLFELQAAMEGNSEAAQIAAQIFDTRAITAILNLTSGSSDLAEALRDATGALEKFADTFLDGNLTAAQRDLNSALDDLAKTFAGQFADDIANVANHLSDIIRFLDDLASSRSITTTWKLVVDPVVAGLESQGWRSLLGFEAFLPPEMAERMYRAFGLPAPSTGSGGRGFSSTPPWAVFDGNASAFGPALPASPPPAAAAPSRSPATSPPAGTPSDPVTVQLTGDGIFAGFPDFRSAEITPTADPLRFDAPGTVFSEFSEFLDDETGRMVERLDAMDTTTTNTDRAITAERELAMAREASLVPLDEAGITGGVNVNPVPLTAPGVTASENFPGDSQAELERFIRTAEAIDLVTTNTDLAVRAAREHEMELRRQAEALAAAERQAALMGLSVRGMNDAVKFGAQNARTYTEQLALQTEALRLAASEGISLGEALDRLVVTTEELDAAGRDDRHVFNSFTLGAEDAAESVDLLQARIRHSISVYGEASEQVRRLVRQLNELHLKAALDELRKKGLANISAFTRGILELNGILPTASESTASLADKLRNLAGATGNDVAAGLADIFDGIREIGEAAGDTEKLVQGLTKAIQGAADVVASLRESDGVDLARSLVGIAGEGIGMLSGIPGLGGLATAAFDLGHQIVLSISDAFTGDSQAARAIRESLTPAVASAFSTGILAALRGQQNWREALEGNVKEAFLGALIQAFVNSAIVGAVLQPLILEFSKLLGRGQYDAARAFLASELPAALNTAMSAVDAFVGAIPAGLLPGTGDAGSTTPLAASTPTITQLPSALVSSVSAPSWINEMNLGAGRFANATEVFEQVVNDLMERGIAVRVTGAAGASTAAVAA